MVLPGARRFCLPSAAQLMVSPLLGRPPKKCSLGRTEPCTEQFTELPRGWLLANPEGSTQRDRRHKKRQSSAVGPGPLSGLRLLKFSPGLADNYIDGQSPEQLLSRRWTFHPSSMRVLERSKNLFGVCVRRAGVLRTLALSLLYSLPEISPYA